MKKFTESLKNLWKLFTYKEGQPSKTAFFLSAATFVALTLWFVLSMFSGTKIGLWTIPEFDAISTASMLTVISGLYIANHKIKVSRDSININQQEEDNNDCNN